MTERRRESRNPIEVATLALLSIVAVSQLALGPTGSRVLLSMPGWSQFLFAAVLLTGCLSALASTLIAGAPGHRAELVGMLLCSVSLGAYALAVIDIGGSWITNPAFGYGGTAVGCAVRAGWLLGHR